MKRLPSKWLVVAAVVAITLTLIEGFRLDAEGFAGNVLAEVAGVLGSVLLAVGLVDRLIERQRAVRWSLVARETERSLRVAIVASSVEAWRRLPAPRSAVADPYSAWLSGPHELADALAELEGEIASCMQPSAVLLDDGIVVAIAPHVTLMRAAVMPRLLIIGELGLIERLAGIESAVQDLEQEILRSQRVGATQRLVRSLAQLVEAMRAAEILLSAHAERQNEPMAS